VVLAGGAWALASLLFTHPPHALGPIWLFVLLAGFVALIWGLPRQHYRLIAFSDLLHVLGAGLTLLLLGLPAGLLIPTQAPWVSLWLSASLGTLGGWCLLRAAFRTAHDYFQPSFASAPHRRTLIVGAGRAGVLVAEELRQHPELGCQVIGFVDDALDKQGLRVHGLPVLGTVELIPRLVIEEHLQQVILAIPSASGTEIRRITQALAGLPVTVKTVPGLYNLLGEQTWRPELRDVSIEDLLRREPITLDQEALGKILRGRTVLITGAGGSIGAELARQVARFHPAHLVLLGRGEGSLWTIERELRDRFPSLSIGLELCDIRSRRRLAQAFTAWKPEIVFHAAAHKHVPYLEAHPDEGIENNILGTRNVLEAAAAHHTRHFVNISTDKAVNPANVLGVTKRIAEYLVAETAQRLDGGHHYLSVRFGNVLGSRGSVVPIFQEQIRKGGPVTITHPEMTRYFMTIPEAAQLVLQAGLLGESSHTYVLDMGEPVKIADLAKDMIRLSGLTPHEDIELLYTGPRPGEKLFEELFYDDTANPSPIHPKVLQARTQTPSSTALTEGLQRLEAALHLPGPERYAQFLSVFHELVPTYSPAPSGFYTLAQAHHTEPAP